MNKASKFILFSALVATAGFGAYKVMADSKLEISKENKKPLGEKTSDSKNDGKTVSADTLNTQTVQSDKKDGKVVVLFRDGTSITDQVIKKEIDEIPEQMSSKMSLAEIRSFLAWKNAYKKVMTDVAVRSGVAKTKEIQDVIEKKKRTLAGFMLLDEKANEMMTFDALKADYDKVWDKNFKDTKEFSLIAITTGDKTLAENIKKNAKDENALKKMLDDNASKIKQMDMDSRPQGIFPSEITSAVLQQGAKTVVGPFEVKGSYMLFFVKSIDDAKKKEFTQEFSEEYKKTALRNFMNEYMKSLYKKYDVKFNDVNGKAIDPFETIDNKTQDKDSEKNLVKLSKVDDNFVLAKSKFGAVSVKDVKEFFKVENLLDKTFVAMAQQFKIPVDRVVVYAAKLVTDDLILYKEVESTGYMNNQKVVDKVKELSEMEALHAYYKGRIKVANEDIKRVYTKFINSIPEEDKNDNEISLKMAFFDTREDASVTLKSVVSGEEKFGSVFKDKEKKKEGLDLGYVTKRGVVPELWAIIKKAASGACLKQIMEIDGSKFGMDGKNYAIIYVADRRPVTLPSLNNEQEREYFKKLAEREQAVEIAKAAMKNAISKIENRNIEDLLKQNADYVDKMLSVLLGYAG